MPHRTPNSVALDFLEEWEQGRPALLTDYLASHPSDAREIMELVADCVMFEALAVPTQPWVMPTRL